jgi:hypothetical protein
MAIVPHSLCLAVKGCPKTKTTHVNCSRTFEEKSRVRFTLIGAEFATGSKIQAFSERVCVTRDDLAEIWISE